MSDLKLILQHTTQKLQQLLKRQEQLKKELERCRAELAEKDKTCKALTEQVTGLEEQVDILRAAAGQMDESAKKQFEKRINQHIKDIEKTIAYLAKS
jgi:chromosome segregation ATPase